MILNIVPVLLFQSLDAFETAVKVTVGDESAIVWKATLSANISIV